jgi:hypothetical protein
MFTDHQEAAYAGGRMGAFGGHVGGTCENGSHPHGTPILAINGSRLRKVEVKTAARLHATVLDRCPQHSGLGQNISPTRKVQIGDVALMPKEKEAAN